MPGRDAASEIESSPLLPPAPIERTRFLCALFLAVTAVLGLAGGLTGTRILDSSARLLVPMAPSTAAMFLLLALPLLPVAARSRMHSSPGRLILAALAGIFVLLNLAGYGSGSSSGLLDWWFRQLTLMTGAPHVNMSPATATLFVLSSISAMATFWRNGGSRAAGGPLAGLLGLAVAANGCVFLLGYAFGTPLLYGSGVVPMARSTAFAFMLLGAVLVCASGPEQLPLRLFIGPTTKASLLRAFVPLMVALSLGNSLIQEWSAPYVGEGNALVVAGIAMASAALVGMVVLVVARRVGGALDVAEQRRDEAEQVVRAALHEKTVMLKELHHRVKNNIQIVSSLLTLQAEYVVDPRDRVLFEESRKRLKTMSMVHEHLYASADLSSVDMRGYVEQLVRTLVEGARPPVRTEFVLEDVRLPIIQCVPCGLLLNELVMNALKHAFAQAEDPLLRVALRPEGDDLVLAVEDNGPGLPEGFDLGGHGTLGLLLMGSLAQQLHGSLTAENGEPGARFVLRFPRDDK
ncbi:sensor histidine kinase [Humidesulfovibrio idahonensis]